MTSWILWIAKPYPHHWDLALEHGLWDTVKPLDIKQGDDVYFWLSGGGLLGRTVALTDSSTLVEDNGPWDDAGQGLYSRRFRLELVAAPPLVQVRWAAVKAWGTFRGAPIGGWASTDNPNAQGRLKQIFLGDDELTIPEPIRVHLDDLGDVDLRERIRCEIAIRQGQPEFRRQLMKVYNRRCAITGYPTVDVLEAAHISPYRGQHTNSVTNGLLLRADIHTLFDRYLLTVTPDHAVRTAPTLRDTPYAALDGSPLKLVPPPNLAPARDKLKRHNALCPWLIDAAPLLF